MLTTQQALARLTLRFVADPIHQALIQLALGALHDPHCRSWGLSVCVCGRVYGFREWPQDSERLSVSHGLCEACETELLTVEVAS